jgi:16S rRNA C967 or C1407 C5-methylase (RsmB/RsmF family)/NOL1/NOP2/fmu family ribosome biogenesis protein
MEKTFPKAFLKRIKIQLEDEYDDFISALNEEPIVSVRTNPKKPNNRFSNNEVIPWCKYGYYIEEKPQFVFDPIIHAGGYYVQEASSMIFPNAIDFSKPLKVLDLCAAPGGKSTLLESFLNEDSIIYSNELVGKRARILEENIIKWGSEKFVITSNRTDDYKHFSGYFDVVLVDAPCSGEGMFRKNSNAIQQWSETKPFKCSVDQRNILDDAVFLVKNGGILIYSTCTYSLEENEQIVQWFYNKYESILEPWKLKLPKNTGISEKAIKHKDENSQNVYKCFPHKVEGEGMFISAFRVKNSAESSIGNKKKPPKQNIPAAVLNEVQYFIEINPSKEIIHIEENQIYLLPKMYFEDVKTAFSKLNVLNAGINLGSVNFKTGKFIPSHNLAMSLKVKPGFPFLELSKENALRFLKKEDLQDINFQKLPLGWILAKYEGLNLGWLKSNGKRLNNLYPKEWKIRKELPETFTEFI